MKLPSESMISRVINYISLLSGQGGGRHPLNEGMVISIKLQNNSDIKNVHGQTEGPVYVTLIRRASLACGRDDLAKQLIDNMPTVRLHHPTTARVPHQKESHGQNGGPPHLKKNYQPGIHVQPPGPMHALCSMKPH